MTTCFNKVGHPIPSLLNLHNEIVPNEVFNLHFMPMAMVDHLVIPSNPNGPHGGAMHKVPNLITFDDNVHIFSPHNACFHRKMLLDAFVVNFLSSSI